jgi:hypothetical protein
MKAGNDEKSSRTLRKAAVAPSTLCARHDVHCDDRSTSHCRKILDAFMAERRCGSPSLR